MLVYTPQKGRPETQLQAAAAEAFVHASRKAQPAYISPRSISSTISSIIWSSPAPSKVLLRLR